MKKRPPYNQEAAIRGALRRAFSRSPLVREVLEESRQEFPRYKKDGTRHKKNWVKRQCQVCNNWESSSKIAVDHIDPVISVDRGKEDWNTYIDRLWCNKTGKANLQRICHTCHDLKTAIERFNRTFKKEQEELRRLETSVVTNEEFKKFLKKFTKKKLLKYPDDWKQRIHYSKLKHGMKV